MKSKVIHYEKYQTGSCATDTMCLRQAKVTVRFESAVLFIYFIKWEKA